MAKRAGHSGKRDKYGRYKGKGGLKPYKSNLPTMKSGTKRKKAVVKVKANKPNKKTGLTGKQKLVIAAGFTVAAAHGAQIAYDVNKYRKQKAAYSRAVGNPIPQGSFSAGGFSFNRSTKTFSETTGRGAAPTSRGSNPHAYKSGAANAAKKAGQQNGGPIPKQSGSKLAEGSGIKGNSKKPYVITDASVTKMNAIVKRYTAGDKTVSFDDYDRAQVMLAKADTIAQGHAYKGFVRRSK